MFRAERVASTYLDLQEKSRAYDRHTYALATNKHYPISTQPTIAASVLIYGRRRDKERELAKKIDKKNAESIGGIWKRTARLQMPSDINRNTSSLTITNGSPGRGHNSWISSLQNVESTFPKVSERPKYGHLSGKGLSQSYDRSRDSKRADQTKKEKKSLLLPPKKSKTKELERANREASPGHEDGDSRIATTRDSFKNRKPGKRDSCASASRTRKNSFDPGEATKRKSVPALSCTWSRVDIPPEDMRREAGGEKSNLNDSFESCSASKGAKDDFHSEFDCLSVRTGASQLDAPENQDQNPQ